MAPNKSWKLCLLLQAKVGWQKKQILNWFYNIFFKYAVSYVVSHVFNNIAAQPLSAAWFCYCQSFFHSGARPKLFVGNDIFGQETIAMGPMIVKWCTLNKSQTCCGCCFCSWHPFCRAECCKCRKLYAFLQLSKNHEDVLDQNRDIFSLHCPASVLSSRCGCHALWLSTWKIHCNWN